MEHAPLIPDRVRKLDFQTGFSWLDIRLMDRRFTWLEDIMDKGGVSAFGLYALLALRSDERGMCFGSTENLAKALRCGTQTIVRARRVLEELDLIATKQPSARAATIYQILSLPLREVHVIQQIKPHSGDTTMKHHDKMIVAFYQRIGKPANSMQVSQGEKIIQRLMSDGFTEAQIQFTIEWTLKNLKDQVFSFGLIPHVIHDALKAQDQREARITRESKERRDREVRRKDEQLERQRNVRLSRFIDALDPSVTAELMAEAKCHVQPDADHLAYREPVFLKIAIDLEFRKLVVERYPNFSAEPVKSV